MLRLQEVEPLLSGSGSLDGEVVRFPDAAAFERAAQLLTDRGVLHLIAKTLPPTLKSFPLQIVFPDTSTVPVQARLQTLKGLEVVVQLVEGREAFTAAWKSARRRAPGANRRRADRKRGSHRVLLGPEACVTFDISKTGLCLIAEGARAVGKVIDGAIEIDGVWAAFQAEVRWSRLNGPNEKGRENLGLRFVKAPAGYERLISAAAETRKEEAPQPAATTAPVLVTSPAAMPAAARRNTPRNDERRGRHRVRYRYRVTIGNARGFTINISHDGFAVETQRMLVPGSEVSGIFYIDAQEITFTGQVRWARAGNQGLGILGQMGIRFRRPPLALVEMLTRK